MICDMRLILVHQEFMDLPGLLTVWNAFGESLFCVKLEQMAGSAVLGAADRCHVSPRGVGTEGIWLFHGRRSRLLLVPAGWHLPEAPRSFVTRSSVAVVAVKLYFFRPVRADAELSQVNGVVEFDRAGVALSGAQCREFGMSAMETLDFAVNCKIEGDRKSTRLNSSHDQISYAVFCLKTLN